MGTEPHPRQDRDNAGHEPDEGHTPAKQHCDSVQDQNTKPKIGIDAMG
jgi:hypothetical protein